jgi:hypothetical protein
MLDAVTFPVFTFFVDIQGKTVASGEMEKCLPVRVRTETGAIGEICLDFPFICSMIPYR